MEVFTLGESTRQPLKEAGKGPDEPLDWPETTLARTVSKRNKRRHVNLEKAETITFIRHHGVQQRF